MGGTARLLPRPTSVISSSSRRSLSTGAQKLGHLIALAVFLRTTSISPFSTSSLAMSSSPPSTTSPLHLVSSRASHTHHPVHGLDALNAPNLTACGPVSCTDEYIVQTKEGYVLPDEEEQDHHSPTATVVGEKPSSLPLSQSEREKGLEIKIVTWKEHDPDDPREWSFRIKW